MDRPARPAHVSSRKRQLVFACVFAGVVVACAGGSAERELDPSGFDRSCSVDSDCALVAPIRDCHSCCGSDEAVRDTPALRAMEKAVNDSCLSRSVCTMYCEHVAACVNGACEKLPPP